jgi:hypothetical protein
VKWLAPLLLLWGCAKDYRELLPFPCPATGACPDTPAGESSGLACIEGQCVQASNQCTPQIPGRQNRACAPDQLHAAYTPCTVVLSGTSQVTTVCIPPNLKSEGKDGPCTFSLAQGALQFPSTPDSDCANGYLCYSPWFDPNQPTACRQFCAADNDCGSNEVCLALNDSFRAADGVCYQNCSPWAAQCASGLSCILFHGGGSAGPGICARPGTLAVGAFPCSPGACAVGLQCMGSFGCQRICRSSADCPSGMACGLSGSSASCDSTSGPNFQCYCR